MSVSYLNGGLDRRLHISTRDLGAFSQNSNVSYHLSAKLTVSPSEHLILDSQQNLRQTLIMTGTEPLKKNGRPPHREARTVKLVMEDNMVQIKKWFSGIQTHI